MSMWSVLLAMTSGLGYPNSPKLSDGVTGTTPAFGKHLAEESFAELYVLNLNSWILLLALLDRARTNRLLHRTGSKQWKSTPAPTASYISVF